MWKIFTSHSQTILFRGNRRWKTDWFQQDLVTAQTAYMSTQALSSLFGDISISSGIWSTNLPDNNPCGFFCWRCLKDKVYNSSPRMKDLKENTHRKIANIPAEQLQMVDQNLFLQCKECLHVRRQRFQRLLWSVNCCYFILNIISQDAYWFISKIHTSQLAVHWLLWTGQQTTYYNSWFQVVVNIPALKVGTDATLLLLLMVFYQVS